MAPRMLVDSVVAAPAASKSAGESLPVTALVHSTPHPWPDSAGWVFLLSSSAAAVARLMAVGCSDTAASRSRPHALTEGQFKTFQLRYFHCSNKGSLRGPVDSLLWVH